VAGGCPHHIASFHDWALKVMPLSRGAAHATFLDARRLRRCEAMSRPARRRGATRFWRRMRSGRRRARAVGWCSLIRLGQGLAASRAAGWIAPSALIVAEIGREEVLPCGGPLDHGSKGPPAWWHGADAKHRESLPVYVHLEDLSIAPFLEGRKLERQMILG